MNISGHPQSHPCGKVYLVGAGPSDIGLLTMKGRQVLKQAQVVIYDALIGPGILHLIPDDAEKIFAGKRAKKHSMNQEEINRLIAEKALEGRIVVRLKGGDPFLFGRGGEELELLCAHHIPYEIVPGVTSAIAVLEYAGIPVTHREMASSVHILTGHKKQNEPLDIDFEALVRAGGTYVFLMGLTAIEEIVCGFLRAGMSPDMPAAAVSQGTGAGQRTVTAHLASLVQKVRENHLKTPAVIVIGRTAALADRFAWYEKLPLFGSRILVTRPAGRNGKLTEILSGLGADVVEKPAVSTRIRDCGEQFAHILSEISTYAYLVFTSAAGVDYFFELLRKTGRDIRCIGNIKLAVIGSATGDALLYRGLMPDLMPEHFNGRSLGRRIRQSVQAGGKVLLMRSSMGSMELVKEIESDGQIQVTDFAIYDTIYTKEHTGVQPEDGSGFEMVFFTSASTVRGFVQMTEGMDYTRVHAVCIGQMTAGQAAAYGMQVTVADRETVESMADAAVSLHHKLADL